MPDAVPNAVALRLDLDPRINFAMQQNDVPVVKALHIDNATEVPLRDVTVEISVEPNFARPWRAHVDVIGEGSSYTIDAVDLELSAGFLGELTERVRGGLHVTLRQGEEVLAEWSERVELLARDEWGGLSSLPEILAAFVMPNHPAIEPLLHSAAGLMEQWTGSSALNGYQSRDPSRALQMAGAIYGALQQRELIYVNPPASFEDQGQRVRLPDHVLDADMATCFDLALLAAGCLEQVGLNALVVIVEGHALTGVWLLDEDFPEPTIDDVLRLRKRVDLNEIAVFDPSGAMGRESVPFDQAVAAARRCLDAGGNFLCAIDIRRARKGRIRPLPERVERQAGVAESERPHETGGGAAAPDVSRILVGVEPEAKKEDEAPDSPSSRTRSPVGQL